jgi:dTMP kinase
MNTTRSQGLLIAIEGIDGAGKQTQAKNLATHFGARVHSFPHYQSEAGQLLRQHLTGQWHCEGSIQTDGWQQEAQERREMLLRQCLMTINRYERQRHIRNDLARGHVVLDRWWLSSLAYGIAEGLDHDLIVEISRELLDPDIWILIDIPVEVGMNRAKARAVGRLQAPDKNERDMTKLVKTREAYIAEFTSMSVGRANRAVIIDGDRPSDLVFADIVKAAARVL